jgi:hypothetical protein
MRPDGTNPAKGIERHKENSRKRYLRGDELQRLTAALAKYPDQRSADVIRMLMLLKTFLETLAMHEEDVVCIRHKLGE